MPYVASETTASNAVFQQAGRQSFADRASARSGGSFDDLLNAIPDAPPEPPAPSRADAPAPERRTAPEPRATARDDRKDPPRSADKANRDRDDQRTQSTDQPAKSTDDRATSQTASQGKTGKAATDATGDKKAVRDDTAQPAKDADASAAAQETVIAAAQQVTTPAPATVTPAVVVDPAAPTATADTTATADAAAGGKAAAAIAAAATTAGAGKATEQTAPAAPATAGTELTADDADALAALAAKAQQSFEDGQEAKSDKSDKSDTKAAAGDRPAGAAKTSGNPLAAVDPNAAPQAFGDAKASAATAGASDLANAVADHQRGKADADAKPAAHAADAINVNTVVAKTDGLQLQNFSSMLQPAHAAGAAAATTTAGGSGKSSGDDAPVSISNVAVEVTSKIASGKNQFDIRLDPPDLGKIHVKVNVDRDGNVITHMVADRTDTLDLLRRDTSDLQRALQDAGLKTSDNSLQFSLRDQTANQQQGQQNGQASRLPVDDDQSTTASATLIARDYGAYNSRTSGIDIRV